jgi:putative endonuclease
MTNRLLERVKQHREGALPGFTSQFRIHRLVYFETYRDVKSAIAREKQIKPLTRAKKIALIEARNPTWEDLAAEWFAPYPRKADSSLRSE